MNNELPMRDYRAAGLSLAYQLTAKWICLILSLAYYLFFGKAGVVAPLVA
jgi:hypothetical protein